MVLTPGFQFLALGVQAAFELANAIKERITTRSRLLR
jgi:hypothetical protein